MDFAELTTMLGSILGVLAPLGGAGIIMYRKQNKRLKESEALLSEVNVEKAKLEAKSSEWQLIKNENDRLSHMNQVLIERNEKLVQINAENEDRHAEDLREKEDRFKDQTNRLREVQRELVSALEREKEHVRMEARLERERDHYKDWKCIKSWRECQEREPEQQIKYDHYTPLNSDCEKDCKLLSSNNQQSCQQSNAEAVERK